MHATPKRCPRGGFPFLATLLFALAISLTRLAAEDETVIEIKAIAGLRYDTPRFQVAPGAKVRLVLENTDDMAHNLVITAPGARMEVATAAMTLPMTPTQDFIPEMKEVLWAIPVLPPGKSGTISFTAPAKQGVYPYVCSFPGHGVIMYGAMYVTKKDMPPLAKDPNVPESAKEFADKSSPHAYVPKPPYLYRMFLRDSGPASIAVALPGEQNYCWDAGACRLRYAWRGGFLDPLPHWRGNGDAFANVKGRIYWRAGAAFPLRIGAREKVPVVQFRGYRLLERYPEFRYEIDGVEVRELIKPQQQGGLQDTFTLGPVKAPVFYVTDPDRGATFASRVGKFEQGVLQLTPEAARSFTITITEVPGQEPLGYWSMNDILTEKKPLPVPGVNGRAIVFDGKKAQFATGLKTDALKTGATFALWAKLAKAATPEQVVVGARAGQDEFALGANLSGSTGFGVATSLAGTDEKIVTSQAADTEWHHLAATFGVEGCTFYLDGQKSGTGRLQLPPGAEVFLGSAGSAKFAAATLDEARIYDRALSDAEVLALYQSDRQPSITPETDK
ncbi:MAG: hypothetical protein QOE70_1971 [Chthoniobacter sp.]|jgi:uncharacterized cupredoxin-like copper-binding protein|nr:hypothetical protein [Chthoniobacter sp.]